MGDKRPSNKGADELQQILARRRSLSDAPSRDGLQFESTPEASKADASAHSVAAVEGVAATVYESTAKESESDARWTGADVVSLGGRSSEDFRAALQRIEEFAEEQKRKQNGETRKPVAHAPAPNVDPANNNTSSDTSSDSDQALEKEEMRNDVKSRVQERYFAFISQGLDPNAAAARAILEATQPQVAVVEDLADTKQVRRAQRRRARRALHGCGSEHSQKSGTSETSHSSQAASSIAVAS